MLYFLKKSWAFVKKNWKYIAAIVGAGLALLFLQRDRISLLEELRSIREQHDKEIKKINSAREEERKKNAAALELLKKRLKEVEKQYEDAKIELDKKKKAEITDIMKNYGSDPEKLAKKLSEATGFTVILPE